MVCLACTSTPNAETIKKKVEAQGYNVEYYAAAPNNEEHAVQVLHAYREEDDFSALVVYWYANEAAAKAAYADHSKNADPDEGYVVIIKGKAVAMGIKELCDLV